MNRRKTESGGKQSNGGLQVERLMCSRMGLMAHQHARGVARDTLGRADRVLEEGEVPVEPGLGLERDPRLVDDLGHDLHGVDGLVAGGHEGLQLGLVEGVLEVLLEVPPAAQADLEAVHEGHRPALHHAEALVDLLRVVPGEVEAGLSVDVADAVGEGGPLVLGVQPAPVAGVGAEDQQQTDDGGDDGKGHVGEDGHGRDLRVGGAYDG
eukprot:scaffold41080_cov46-Prasinocladus_malaysianus.AAC.2